MKKTIVSIYVMFALSLPAAQSFGAEPHHMPPQGSAPHEMVMDHKKGPAPHEMVMDHNFDKKSSSEADKKILADKKKFLEATLELRAQIARKNMELEIIQLADPVDKDTVKVIRKALVDLHAEVEKASIDAGIEKYQMGPRRHMMGKGAMRGGHKKGLHGKMHEQSNSDHGERQIGCKKMNK